MGRLHYLDGRLCQRDPDDQPLTDQTLAERREGHELRAIVVSSHRRTAELASSTVLPETRGTVVAMNGRNELRDS